MRIKSKFRLLRKQNFTNFSNCSEVPCFELEKLRTGFQFFKHINNTPFKNSSFFKVSGRHHKLQFFKDLQYLKALILRTAIIVY